MTQKIGHHLCMIPCINSVLLLVEITAFRLESKSCKGFSLKINFQPMRALEFKKGNAIYNAAYAYKFQLKTTL